MAILNWAWARLQEGTTWAGVGIFASAVAVSLNSHTGLAVAILSGIAAVAIPEGKK